jgi:hypothetical protein
MWDTQKYYKSDKYIYAIYRLRGPDEKNCVLGLENVPRPKTVPEVLKTTRARRARDVFKTEDTVFLIRTDAAGK